MPLQQIVNLRCVDRELRVKANLHAASREQWINPSLEQEPISGFPWAMSCMIQAAKCLQSQRWEYLRIIIKRLKTLIPQVVELYFYK